MLHLFFQFSVVKRNVTPLTRADSDGVIYRDDEDASIAYFTCPCSLHDGFYGLVHILVAHHNGEHDALYGACVVHHSPVNSSFAGLLDAAHVAVLKPLDVDGQQSLFHVFETAPADNCFNLLHILVLFLFGLKRCVILNLFALVCIDSHV